jgi:hypothetical protein
MGELVGEIGMIELETAYVVVEGGALMQLWNKQKAP